MLSIISPLILPLSLHLCLETELKIIQGINQVDALSIIDNVVLVSSQLESCPSLIYNRNLYLDYLRDMDTVQYSRKSTVFFILKVLQENQQ